MLRALPLLVGLALAGAARAEAPATDRLSDGAAIYAALRPAATAIVLSRLGIDRTRGAIALKEKVGIDPANPALLAPLGLDGGAPIVASLFEVVTPGDFLHHRVVATVSDPARLTLLLAGMASSPSGQVTVYGDGSPEGRAQIRASSTMIGVAVLRVSGDQAILDVAQPFGDARLPGALALARRFPIAPSLPWRRSTAARRMLTDDQAAAVYVDGRILPSLMVPLALRDLVPLAVKGRERKLAVAHTRALANACARRWSAAPAVFDDAALTFEGDANGVTAKLGFGEPVATPARPAATGGGLGLAVADDAALDLDGLGRSATAAFTVALAGVGPLRKLPRSGVLADRPTLASAAADCGPAAWALLAVRHWPQVAGLLLDELAAGSGFGALVDRVRNVAVLIREVSASGARYAVAATFDPGARQAIEIAFSAVGQPETLSFGNRQPGVYPLNVTGLSGGVLAIEDLPLGKALAVAADSSQTLKWVYAGKPAAAAPPPSQPPPIVGFRLATDARGLLLNVLGNAGASAIGDALAAAGHLDGRLTDDGEVLLLTVRAPVK